MRGRRSLNTPMAANTRMGRHTGRLMADPLHVLAERLQPAFDAVAGRAGVDPVIRPSDHADAQANGALPLAKELGRNPRRGRPGGRSTRPTSTGVATAEIAGPGFVNLTLDSSFIAALAGRRRRRRSRSASSRPPSPSASSSTTRRRTWPRRCTSATSARRSSATPSSGCSTPSATTSFARTTSATGAGRSGCSSSTSSTSASSAPSRSVSATSTRSTRRPRSSSRTTRTSSERARARVVLLQQGDEETLRLWRLLFDRERRALERPVRQARRAAHRRRPGGGEPLRVADARHHRAPRPAPVCWRSPTAPRSCSHRDSPTARANRCR